MNLGTNGLAVKRTAEKKTAAGEVATGGVALDEQGSVFQSKDMVHPLG